MENNSEIENIILNSVQKNKSIISHYNFLLNDSIFCSLLPNLNQNDLEGINSYFKINAEIRSIEDKLMTNNSLNQKNEFVSFMNKYVFILARHNLFYRLIDIMFIMFKLSDRNVFVFLVNFLFL